MSPVQNEADSSLRVATRSMAAGTTQVQTQLPDNWCAPFSGVGDGAVRKKPSNSVKQLSGGRKSGQFSSSSRYPQASKKTKK
ncbi:hypothetical protein BaRGS_00015321 [Batillaria attramentaria]|uniref:Uncharacterized protein n=1 Tax=Batillaria attramentaria TaxID=370345 RepID=A0ABD0L1N9_9CAEN